jgi:hypothetical protein
MAAFIRNRATQRQMAPKYGAESTILPENGGREVAKVADRACHFCQFAIFLGGQPAPTIVPHHPNDIP